MKVIATTRHAQGTGASRRLRRAGKVPGIVYGTSATPTPIEVDHNAIFHALRKESFHASVLDLELDGQAPEKVLLRDVQMHPFRPIVSHVDFQRVAADQKIHVKVPLHFINAEHSPAVKLSGAIVSHVLNELEVSCLPASLPEFIDVDLISLALGQSIHVSDLKLPADVTAMAHGNPVVAIATVPRGQEEPTVEAAAAPTDAEADAAAGAGEKSDKPEKAEKSEKSEKSERGDKR